MFVTLTSTALRMITRALLEKLLAPYTHKGLVHSILLQAVTFVLVLNLMPETDSRPRLRLALTLAILSAFAAFTVNRPTLLLR